MFRYFNSFMVRLEAVAMVSLDTLNRHFNSFMVRLEVFYEWQQKNLVIISIPLWYD